VNTNVVGSVIERGIRRVGSFDSKRALSKWRSRGVREAARLGSSEHRSIRHHSSAAGQGRWVLRRLKERDGPELWLVVRSL